MVAATVARPHPLDPITQEEIVKVVAALRSRHDKVWIKAVAHEEPAKKIMLPYLDAEARGDQLPYVPRLAYALFLADSKDPKIHQETHEIVYNLDEATVVSDIVAAPHLHSAVDMGELDVCESKLMANPEFQKAIEKFKLPKGARVVADVWIYGCDAHEPLPRMTTFCVYYYRDDNPDGNYYANPLPLQPIMNMETWEILTMGECPTGGKGNDTSLDDDPVAHQTGSEYIPEMIDDKIRTDLKPYRVIQPEGPSFTVNGNEVKWQGWKLRVGFHYREGLTLHNASFQGRSVLYRMNVSEMTVPYGDPRSPFHRKQAFDFGDVGGGITANELALGCDCLGHIKYFDACFVEVDGTPKPAKNVVCLHEQDNGLLWKHTGFRTNRAALVRSRELVLQSILTLANYEYIFAFKLDQAGGIHLEIRATGILSTTYIKDGETSPYGTVVAPGVLATNHQHIFSVRIDPAVDGHKNTVVQEDSVPMPLGPENPHGVGYTVHKTPIKTSTFADLDVATNRTFKIINPSSINPVSKRPVGYKLHLPPTQQMIALKDSIACARAQFADHHLWVTKQQDGERYASGVFTNQSSGRSGGVREWIARNDSVEAEDICLWATIGFTHNPRCEDFPVMPMEAHSLSLKPVDFFTRSPAMQIPQSTQAFNQSVAINGTNGANGSHGNGHVACH